MNYVQVVWIIGNKKRGEPLFSLLKYCGVPMYFFDSTEKSFFVPTLNCFGTPDFIIFNGEEFQLDFILRSLIHRYNKRSLPPLLLISPISPEGLFTIERKNLLKEMGMEVNVLVFLNKTIEKEPAGMVLGVSQQKGMRPLRNYIRDLHIPLLVTGVKEALILNHLYNDWNAEGEDSLEILNKYCHSLSCDGVTILRGLGLDSQIGQWNHSYFPLIENWLYASLLLWIHKNGGKGAKVTIWGNPQTSLLQILSWKCSLEIYNPKQEKEVLSFRWESVNGADLLINLSDNPQSTQLRVAEWAENQYRFRRPQVIDGMGLYEPEELKAVGYDYLSVFRYRYNFLRNREE